MPWVRLDSGVLSLKARVVSVRWFSRACGQGAIRGPTWRPSRGRCQGSAAHPGVFLFFFSHCPCLFPPVVCLSASPSLCAPAGVSLSPLRPRRCSWSGLWDGGMWDAGSGSDGLGLGLLHTLNPNRPRPAASRASLTACPSLSLPGAGLPLTHLVELSEAQLLVAQGLPGAPSTGVAVRVPGSAWPQATVGDVAHPLSATFAGSL